MVPLRLMAARHRTLVLVVVLAPLAAGHGAMLLPTSWSDPGGGLGMRPQRHCSGVLSGCEWFTNHTFIRGPATLDPALWTYTKQAAWEAGLPKLGEQEACTRPAYLSPVLPEDHGEEPTDNAIPPLRDYFARHPWRAPGTAPLHSPCGAAGGNPSGCPAGAPPGEGGRCPGGGWGGGPLAELFPFRDVVTTTWTAGEVAEVAWGITANHGGGYSYRLCRLGPGGRAALTEACFQAGPLLLAGREQWVQRGPGRAANRTVIPAVRTRSGTHPPGSQWTRNPIPACAGAYGGFLDTDYDCKEGTQFPPSAPDLKGFGVRPGAAPAFHFAIVDRVRVPADLESGEYVLSFRWDCEQTSQVWSTCASLRIRPRP